MSQVTTHVLDTSSGRPASDVPVILFSGPDWKEKSKGKTNQDGRINDLIEKDKLLPPGIYKLRFETKDYFNKNNLPVFYPFIEIIFEITGSDHYHVPLLLSPFGYSTYRVS